MPTRDWFVLHIPSQDLSRYEKSSGSGGSTFASAKLKGIDGTAPPGVERAAQFDSTRETLLGYDTGMIDRLLGLS